MMAGITSAKISKCSKWIQPNAKLTKYTQNSEDVDAQMVRMRTGKRKTVSQMNGGAHQESISREARINPVRKVIGVPEKIKKKKMEYVFILIHLVVQEDS